MPARKWHAAPIRVRLALWFTLFLLASIVVTGLFLLSSIESSLNQEIDEALQLRAARVEGQLVQVAAALGGQLVPGALSSHLLDLEPREEFSAPGIYVNVLDRDGAMLASSLNLPGGRLPVTSALMDAALAGHEGYETLRVESERVRVLAEPVTVGGQVIGVILVGESLHLLDSTLRGLQQFLLVAAIGAAAVSLVGGWWLTSRALNPVSEVIRVARRIGATRQFDQRIAEPGTRDELHQLTVTLNDMLDRIERSFARQREFLADVAHELRGPLMIIRGNVDLMVMGLPEDERRQAAREVAEEVERMAQLLSDLMFLAEADAGEIVERQPVALHDVVREACERARRLDGGAHQLSVACDEPVIVQGDRSRLGQLVWNLLENALRYTPAGGRIGVTLRARGKTAELVVEDSGTGIPQEHLPRIFERFYRVDQARSRRHGGTGLGLAIVKQVAEAHDGRVGVQSQPGQGSTFTVTLPTLQST